MASIAELDWETFSEPWNADVKAARMQWLLAGYAQKLSDAKQLGIRFVAVLPNQLIEGTTIGARAAAAYGAQNGITADAFMKRFDVPPDCDKVAAAIVTALGGG